jgi:hypothetical protein
MARPRLRALLLEVLRTDVSASLAGAQWRCPCVHCRTPQVFGAEGEPVTAATLEHLLPRAWFRKPAARRLCAGLSGPDDLRNLGIACERCNHGKGKGPDARGPGDPTAYGLVDRLLRERLARWRDPV